MRATNGPHHAWHLPTLPLLLQEVLPQAPACGMPWDWHRRPHGGPSIMHQRHGSLGGLDKRSVDVATAPTQSDSELGA